MQSLCDSSENVALPAPASAADSALKAAPAPVRELDGPAGLEPTRFGDWERRGRCIDF
jgi:hypothetical protein